MLVGQLAKASRVGSLQDVNGVTAAVRKPASEPAAKGDSYEWQWVANSFIGRGKILKADNKDHFDFSFIDENTIVRIRLKEKKGRTLVELTQRHFHKKPADRKKITLVV
jgi:hypothetical protein